ncbi:MAG: hypothetical protein IPK00_25350 [Deltaproteobacteria bacterium]|nr:hypothetical protein [Deltaproteobacteria bacterium]
MDQPISPIPTRSAPDSHLAGFAVRLARATVGVASRSFGSGLALVALVAGAPPAIAAELDQESPFQSGFTQFNERPVAQRFDVGLSGQLETIEVFASQLSPIGNLLVSIHPVVDGVLALPGGSVPIATGSIPLLALPSSSAGGTGPGWVTIDLDVPVAITAGETLALVLQKDSGGDGGAGGVAWFGNPALYAFGDAVRYDPGGIIFCTLDPFCEPGIAPPSWIVFTNLDFAFRTYVPEPASGLALAAGAAGLAALARARAPASEHVDARPAKRLIRAQDQRYSLSPPVIAVSKA